MSRLGWILPAVLIASPVVPGVALGQSLTTLVSFNGSNGSSPDSGLITDANGNLFGAAYFGGPSGMGTVFKIARTAGGYAPAPTVLASFDGTNGSLPAGLLTDANGNLLGITLYNTQNYGGGTLFKIAKTAGGYASTPTVLYGFDGAHGSHPQGLIPDANGNLLGWTFSGGAADAGAVFQFAKTAGGYASTPTVVVSFDGTTGSHPSGLIADGNGNLFGTTFDGGAYNFGTVFEIPKTAGGYSSTPTVLFSFDGTHGAYPQTGLIADASGNLFGTTFNGGVNGLGTVYEIAKTATGYASTPAVLFSFDGIHGRLPIGTLIADASGNLFGTTVAGGVSDQGTVFEIAKSGLGYANTPTVLVSFVGANGVNPVANLIAGANGNLFGTTDTGGAYGLGTVFEITNSGFIPPARFAGVSGTPNCGGVTLSTLVQTYGSLAAAAKALGYANVADLQNAVGVYCGK